MPQVTARLSPPDLHIAQTRDRSRLIRLAASLWAAVALGIAMIIWSALLLPFIALEQKAAKPDPRADVESGKVGQ